MTDAPPGRPDPGLFWPEPVTWQMHSDPMMWIAGIRALHLQALHPRAVRGVTQNADFLRSPPVSRWLVPARALLWRRVAAPDYRSLPPYAPEFCGRPAPPPATVDRRPRATGVPLRAIPARLRRQLPPGHIRKATARPGPGSRPTAYKLRRQAAILDGPGRAQR